MVLSKKEQQFEKEMLLRENMDLNEKLNLLKKEVVRYSSIAAQGYANAVKIHILSVHFPLKNNCDFTGIHFLSFLERIIFKIRFCKEMIDNFYINVSGSDENATEKALELAPILLKHERYLEAIQRALLSSFMETYNNAVCMYFTIVCLYVCVCVCVLRGESQSAFNEHRNNV